jgi:hypothetical protein
MQAAASSSKAVFLASIEAKLRNPFSSLNVSKAIERDVDPVTFTKNVNDLVFSKQQGSGLTDGVSNKTAPNVDKTLKLRVLLSLLGLDDDAIMEKLSPYATDGKDSNNIFWTILRNAQDDEEEIWVRIVGGYVQGMMFGKLSSTAKESGSETLQDKSPQQQRNLIQFKGEEAEAKLTKTNTKIIKETLKAWNKVVDYSDGIEDNSGDEKDEILAYAPTKYNLLDPCILKSNMPSLYYNSEFRLSGQGGSREDVPPILHLDLQLEKQRAMEEEREMEDHKRTMQEHHHSTTNEASHGPRMEGEMPIQRNMDSKQQQPKSSASASSLLPQPNNASKIGVRTEAAVGGRKVKSNMATMRKGVSATTKMLKSNVTGPPRSALMARGTGRGRGGGARPGGMSEEAKAILAARQARRGGMSSGGALKSPASRFTASNRSRLMGGMESRKGGAGSSMAGGKMKMAMLDMTDVKAIEEERRSGMTKKRGRGRGRGGGGAMMMSGSLQSSSARTQKRPMSMSSQGGGQARVRVQQLTGFDAPQGQEDGNEKDDDEVSQTEVDIIGQFGAATATSNNEDDDVAVGGANEDSEFQNPMDLRNSGAAEADSSWGMSMPDLQTNMVFGSSMPFGEENEDEEDDS